ncbi:MAG TPA: PDZ domain-containing protein [Rhizomicrobium sp.]|nr:PDZ domain-containing protein [Rhizomicrobium sp.]
MGRVLAIVVAAILLFAGAVWYGQSQPMAPLGYSGLQFARLTQGASGRTPALDKGVLVLAVDAESPAEKAGIEAGAVVAAIDGEAVQSAAAAAEKIGNYREGVAAQFVFYAPGEAKPETVSLVFTRAPDPEKLKKYSVHPPRILAKDPRELPPIGANAAWTRRIARGASTKPLLLHGIGHGGCNGLVPEKWQVVESASGMLRVSMPGRFQQALTLTAPLAGATPANFLRRLLEEKFGAVAKLSPATAQSFGFIQVAFGNAKGGTGFVQYRVRDGRIQLWVAAAAAGEASWSLPIAGAVAFTLNCGPASMPRDPAMSVTSVSSQCLGGKCQDSDFAASYMATLKLGYVHDAASRTYLINPKRDYWLSGAEGPGFYHQVGGENEKLEPGRTNDAPKGA